MIGQFGPELTKLARDQPILTGTDQNDPWLVNSDPKFGSQTDQNGSW